MAIDRASRFLQAFNEIHRALDTRVPRPENESGHRSFTYLLPRSKDLTDRQRDRLKTCASLRNVIVHEPRDGDHEIIADPRESTVQWLEQQVDIITNPPLVIEVLKLDKVEVLDADDDLGAFLTVVRESDFSQAPVRGDDDELSLITTNTVTRWLASEYTAGDGAALEHAKLREMQRFVEESDELILKPRNLKAVEAARIFAGQEGRNAPAAIVLTEHGKHHQTPLGLCSQTDVAQLLRALGV